jgi:general secretion pathway protein K
MAGTLNINKVKLSLLQEVLIRCGLDNGTEVTSVANSILDWIDEDGLRRAESAEKDYYLSRGTSPYWPKNNEIESIEELLLVKEVTPEIFYGNEQRPGLKDFFSAYGQGEKMDINSATPQTFSLIRGLPQDVIDNICSLRQDQPLKDLSELASLVPQRYFSQIHKYYYVSNLKVLKVEASLVFESGKYGRSFQRMYNIGS